MNLNKQFINYLLARATVILLDCVGDPGLFRGLCYFMKEVGFFTLWVRFAPPYSALIRLFPGETKKEESMTELFLHHGLDRIVTKKGKLGR